MSGDTDIAAVGSLLAQPARAKVLLALADGRAARGQRARPAKPASRALRVTDLGRANLRERLGVELPA